MGIVAGILGVIIGLFVLAWTQGMFGDATSKLDEGRTFELVNRLRANVKEGFFEQSTYGTNANLAPMLTAMGKVPGSARGPSNTIVSPYGGNIAILGSGRRFVITVEELGNEQCFNLGKRFTGGAAADFGVVNVQVTGATRTSVFGGAPRSRTLAQVEGDCDEGAAGNYLSITFR